ncbi:response regulator [bacterium]|nr:response regulator [bacterium]
MRLSDRMKESNIEIMIVEDSPTQAAQLKHALVSHEYKVAVARNGEEAWQMLQKESPTIILSDVLMPGMNGYELCEKIKKHDTLKRIPVLLLTQLSGPRDILRGLECGADHFITKPYNEDYLLSHIQYILVNRELRRNAIADLGIEIFFAGHKHFLTSDRIQILDLLFSTYEAVIQRNQELEKKNRELEQSLETIRALRGLIPICSHCKKIRNDEGYWQKLEEYIHENSEAEFTHGLCPDCEKSLYSKYFDKDEKARKP